MKSSTAFVGRQSVRRTGMTLPGATSGSPTPHNASRVIAFNYGTAGNLNDLAGRVQSVDMTGDVGVGTIGIASYTYLGAAQLVGTLLEEPAITNRLFSTGPSETDVHKLSDAGAGMDRFGRVKESRWGRNIGDGDHDAYAYWTTIGYGYDGTILSTVDHLRTRQDVLYTNDGLHRLVEALEGQANSGVTALDTDTQTFKQTWDLSQTGNWLSFNDYATTGTPTRTETRTNTAVNEIATRTIDGGSPTSFVYNKAGQLTDDGEKVYTYDAFGRLRFVHARGSMGARGKLIEESRYNGLGHRISVKVDTDVDGDLDGLDNTVTPTPTSNSSDAVWVDQVYDDSWRVVATFKQGDDADKPHERFVYHNAGMDGRGTSSYIDDVILRERSNAKLLSDTASPTLGDRLYYLQNWRHDVVATVTHQCRIVERTRYTSYGVPTTYTGGDFNHDAQVDDDDFLLFDGPYNNLGEVNYAASTSRSTGDYSEFDLNVDGIIEDGDFGVFAVAYGNFVAAEPGELSHRDTDPAANIDSRVGYAGYSWSPSTATYNVRHRAYNPTMGNWATRDSMQYINGPDLYRYAISSPLVYVDPTGLEVGHYPGEAIDCTKWKGNEKCWGDKQNSNGKSPSENKYINRKCSKETYPTLSNPTLGDAYCWERARAANKGYSWLEIGLIAVAAEDFAKAMYGGIGQETQRNALQHCVYSCGLRRQFDEKQAEDILDAHECATIHWDLYPAKDSFEDWKWNGQGGGCAISGVGCSSCCAQKVKDVLDSKYNTTPGLPSSVLR